MNKTFYRFFLFLGGSFVCLYLTFSTTVNIPYVNHDSIRYFHKFYNEESGSRTYPQYQYEYALGRPVTAELEEFLYRKVNHLSDIARLRSITIFIFALCTSLLAMTALSAGMEIIPAFCLSLAIFTLPGVQDLIFVPYLTNALALFLSLLAYFILTKKLKYGVHFILSFVLLEVSFCLYPPSTLFFFVPVALMVIFQNDWQVSRKTGIRDIFLWILAAVIYYVTLREFFYTQIKLSGHEISFTWKQTLMNIMSFLPRGVPQTFNFWNVYYSKTLGIFMLVFVAVFITADFFVTRKIGWGRAFALAAIFFVSNLVWFLFGGYMPREFIASQAMALVSVYWCGEWLINIGRMKRELLICVWSIFFVSIGLIVANQMITSNVLNNYSELMFVRSRLAQSVNSSTKEIHVIELKDRAKGYNGLPTVYDNINSSTSDYEIPDLVRVALKDMGDPFDLHCIVTFSNDGESFKALPDTVVIDMNDLAYISLPEKK